MEVYSAEATDETPRVNLDPVSHVLEFEGLSLPGDVTEFYDPILEWLGTYKATSPEKTSVIFKMEYFNTASSKMIMDILTELEELHEEHQGVSVTWYFKEDDEDMEESGEEYDDIVDLPFTIKSL